MTTTEILGLCLQLFGTALAAFALTGEWRDRRPKVRPPARPHVSNPWEGKWKTRPGHISERDRERYRRNLRSANSSFTVSARDRTDPDMLNMAEFMASVFRETRENLREDWDRQERGNAQLHAATTALFRSLQEAHRATRRRVLLEMAGLLIVALGTVVSSL